VLLQAGKNIAKRGTIDLSSRAAAIPAALPRVLHNWQSCKRAAAAVVARAGSNGNSTGSQTHQQQISIIASDVDGTLLNSQQQLTPGVEAAVKQAADAGVPVRANVLIAYAARQEAYFFCL
jgi:hypothetical protein